MAWPCTGPMISVRRIRRSSVPCNNSMRSFSSLVDMLGEPTRVPVECQGEGAPKTAASYTSAATASDTPLFSSTHLIFDCDAVYNAPMSLEEYKKKRKFSATPEPAPKKAAAKSSEDLIFVVQKHAATRLHYDFRLEWKGVLLSWAV